MQVLINLNQMCVWCKHKEACDALSKTDTPSTCEMFESTSKGSIFKEVEEMLYRHYLFCLKNNKEPVFGNAPSNVVLSNIHRLITANTDHIEFWKDRTSMNYLEDEVVKINLEKLKVMVSDYEQIK